MRNVDSIEPMKRYVCFFKVLYLGSCMMTDDNIVYYNKKARSHRLRDPLGLEGTITCPIVYWRAFFILFHHFIDNIYVYFGDLSL